MDLIIRCILGYALLQPGVTAEPQCRTESYKYNLNCLTDDPIHISGMYISRQTQND